MLKELEPIADKLNEERARLNRSLDRITEEQAAQAKVNPEWTIKDVLAHLAGAERGMLRMAERIAKGENPRLPVGYDNDEYNARQVAKRQGRTLVELRAELEGSRAELLALMASVTAPQLELTGEHPLFRDVKLKELFSIISNHESGHAAEISGALK